MPKVHRNGQAEILETEQMDQLMRELSAAPRAILSVCRFTAARINEALSLRWESLTPTHVVIPKMCTKKKMGTRSIHLNPLLKEEMNKWRDVWVSEQGRDPQKTDLLFPSRKDANAKFPRRTVDHAMRKACEKLGFVGCSTHSFRRSALTQAHSKGVPLKTLQTLSGHASLDMLSKYISISEEQRRKAALAFG